MTLGFSLVLIGYASTRTDCSGDSCLVSQPLIGLVAVGLVLLIGVLLLGRPFYASSRRMGPDGSDEESFGSEEETGH